MKRCLAMLLCLLFCLPAGCTRPDRTTQHNVNIKAQEVADAVAGSQSGADTLSRLSDEVLTGYLNSLGLTGWADAAVLTGQGMDAREITVVKMTDHPAAQQAAQCLEGHRQARMTDFFGYAPDQVELLERAQVLVQDCYAAFLACSDAQAAKETFAACFEGETVTVHTTPEQVETPEPTPELTPEPSPEADVLNPDLDISGFVPFNPPGDVDMTLYDNSALIAAWKSGDETTLTDKERAILKRCREAFDEVVRDGMTEFERETALHDWLMAHGTYDELSRDNLAHIGRPDNGNPYGMLVGGYGICLGFATTFQLLMDLAEVECITVVGAAFASTGDHAWNMVKLDGEWYCVDVTWNNSYQDGGYSPNASHQYFNVTSDWMRATDHQWDYRNVPETTATRYGWGANSFGPN